MEYFIAFTTFIYMFESFHKNMELNYQYKK